MYCSAFQQLLTRRGLRGVRLLRGGGNERETLGVHPVASLPSPRPLTAPRASCKALAQGEQTCILAFFRDFEVRIKSFQGILWSPYDL